MPVQKPSLAPEFITTDDRVPSSSFTLSSLSGASFGVRWHAVRGGIARPADRMACHARVTGRVAAAADARGASPSRDGSPARPDRAEVDARSPVPTSAMLHQGNPRVSNIEASVARRHQPGTR